ncbi:MAG: peptidylprolyl isomerase [Flavobacteriales bacterium]
MIENIRKRRGLLIFFIGIGMLGFLIPYDAVMSLFGRTPGSETVGELNGRSLNAASWQEEMTKVKETNLYNRSDADVRTAAWNDLVNETIYGADIEALNYVVGEEEYEDIRFGVNPSSLVKQAYYGGQVNEESRQRARDLFEQQIGIPEKRQKELILKRYKIEKLETLLKKGFYANALDAERDYLSKNDKVQVEMVAAKYDAIPDSTISLSDSQVMSFFNKNKSNLKYRQNPFRTVSYLSYDVQPSAADSAAHLAFLTERKEDFRTTDNDSSYIVRVSDDHLYFKQNYKPGTVAGATDSLLISGSIGTLVGPYVDAGAYKLAKIIGKDPVVERANARHIFLTSGRSDRDSVMMKANEIKEDFESGTSFSSLAAKWSEDDSTATKGGVLGWFGADDETVADQKVKNALRNRALSAEKDRVQIVDVPGGISVLEVTDFEYNGTESVIAFLPKGIVPTEATKDEIYEEVRAFSLDYSSAEELIAAAEEQGLSLNETKVFPASRSISGIQNSEDMVRWAFSNDTKKNNISNVFTIGEQYIVAALTEVQDEEMPNFSSVADDVRTDALKSAKFDMLKDKMKTGTLEDIEAAVEGAKKSSPTMSLNTFNVPGLGTNEAEAVGVAFGMGEGVISPVIEGELGAIIMSLIEPKLAAPKESYADDQATLQSSYTSKYNRIRGSLSKALVKDERNR